MGAELVTRMIKGPIHLALEACVNDYHIDRDAYGKEEKAYHRRELLFDALTFLSLNEDCLPEYLLILKEIVQVTEKAADYLAAWYEQWSEEQFREPIVRCGIIRAIEAAKGPPVLPIDFYWLGVGDPATYGASPNSYPFETIVTRSPWQVTCLLLTPPWPKALSQEDINTLKGDLTRDADIWTVKDRDRDTSFGRNTQGVGETLVGHGRVVTKRAKALALTHPIQSSTVRRQQAAQKPEIP